MLPEGSDVPAKLEKLATAKRALERVTEESRELSSRLSAGGGGPPLQDRHGPRTVGVSGAGAGMRAAMRSADGLTRAMISTGGVDDVRELSEALQ